MKYLFIITLSLVTFSITGCIEVVSEENKVIYESILKGTQSGVENQQLQVIRNDSQLNSLWNEHTTNLSPIPEKPEVDFSNELLVAVFLGAPPTSTCSNTLDITGAQLIGKSVSVNVSIRVPRFPVQCLISETPFEIIKLKNVNNYIGFNIEVSENDL